MHGPYPLYLAGAAPGQLGRPLDRLASGAQSNDALMGDGIGDASGILAARLRDLDTLALAFAPCLVVVARHLQGEFQQ